ncbi:DUF6221 family protein [Nocardia sp. NPDC058519]|uniref:DUF6221 family protein n=1 Tax=Nocardia sp. NPDC058519 TaxID=3346535 RepID=UPI00365C4DDD
MDANVIEHIASHDPARVLRQVAATRALMTSLVDAVEDEMSAGRQMHEERKIVEFGPIAAIWSDHPDFRPEWSNS